ncbi:MAG: TldD/PmbA family protein [Deltaproteobacteria bacterium]|nr:TldD/PmbA family protein [Deltaproteobacteria bacterium]
MLSVPAPLLDLGLVSRLIGRALAQGGSFAEVYVQRRVATSLELEGGEVKSAQSSREYGVGIRVLRGASAAYAYSDDSSEGAIFECADVAARVAGADGEVASLARPLALRARPHHADPSQVLSPADLDGRAALLLRAHEAAHRVGPALDQVTGMWADVDDEVLIANSEGLLVQDRRALVRLGLEVILRDGDGSRKVGSSGGGSRRGVDHYLVQTPEAIGQEAVRMASAQLGATAAPLGERVVVVGPGPSGVLLHEAVGHGLEADFIRKKSSLFAGRLGQPVASELVTVIDDGTVPGKRGSLNVDDEGTPTAKNVLIERGVLRSYLTDRQNAELMGAERTGNGRRQSFRHPPLPRMTNTFLLRGSDDPADILRGVKSGLYCRAFGGGQVDIANGSFVFEVREGYLIEDGQLGAPVKGATLVGNGPDVLSKIARVGHDAELDPGVYTCGKDGQSVPVGVGLPTVRIDGITVGGTGT